MFATSRGRSALRPQSLLGAVLFVTATLFTIFPQITPAQTSSGNSGTVLRINAGGPGYTDSAGNVWSADTGFTGGAAIDWSLPTTGNLTAASISGTSDPTLFLTARYGATQYAFALPNGTYQLNLSFAENWVNSTFPNGGVGFRVFSVQANGVTIIPNLDVFAAVGAHTALVKSATVTVTTGQLVLTCPNPPANGWFVNAIEVIGQAASSGSTASGSTAISSSATSNTASASTAPAAPAVPTTPTGLLATAVSTSQINLSWAAASGGAQGSGLSGYQVYRGGVLIGTTTAAVTSYADSGLAPSASYSYTVTAFGNATPTANESQPSAPASATTLAAAPGSAFQCNDSGAAGKVAVDANVLGLNVTMPQCTNYVSVPLANATLTLQRWHPTDLTDPNAIWQPLSILPAGWSLWTPNGWQTLAQLQSAGGVLPAVTSGLSAVTSGLGTVTSGLGAVTSGLGTTTSQAPPAATVSPSASAAKTLFRFPKTQAGWNQAMLGAPGSVIFPIYDPDYVTTDYSYRDPLIDANIGAAQSRGVKVFAYISGRDSGAPTSVVEADINTWMTQLAQAGEHADGVFIGSAGQAGSVGDGKSYANYWIDIINWVHSTYGVPVFIHPVGAAFSDDQQILTVADSIVMYESYFPYQAAGAAINYSSVGSPSFGSVAPSLPQTFMSTYPRSKFGAMANGVAPQDLANVENFFLTNNVGYLYVSDVDYGATDNPIYWAQELLGLTQVP